MIFSSLFRHMQISLMLGCPTVALNIALIILSLDPLGDPFYMLLFIDHLLVVSRRFDLMELWCSGGSSSSSSNNDSENSEGGETAPGTAPGSVCFILGTPLTNGIHSTSISTNTTNTTNSNHNINLESRSGNGTGSESESESGSESLSPLSISDSLPNWAYSYAISCYLQAEQVEKEQQFSSSSSSSSSGTNSNQMYRSNANAKADTKAKASEALLCAVKRWPFLMASLLEIVSTDTSGAELQWESLLSHALFKNVDRYEVLFILLILFTLCISSYIHLYAPIYTYLYYTLELYICIFVYM